MGIELQGASLAVGILEMIQLAFQVLEFQDLQNGSLLEGIFRLLIERQKLPQCYGQHELRFTNPDFGKSKLRLAKTTDGKRIIVPHWTEILTLNQEE